MIAIYGDKPEYADHSKVALLSTLLHQWSLDQKSTWMIGDRILDFQAARANHIGTLAAGWGYGTVEELALAGAVAATSGRAARSCFSAQAITFASGRVFPPG